MKIRRIFCSAYEKKLVLIIKSVLICQYSMISYKDR
jgi:hypothetical protein